MSMRDCYWRLVTLAVTAAVCAASPLPPSPASALNESRILFALAAAHVPVRSAEVEFLAPIVLKHPLATLRVAHMERWQADYALVRIHCAAAGECIPFYVIVRWSDPLEREAALGPSSKEPLQVQGVSSAASPKPILVRAGQSATLFLETARMRIATPIICLQSGSQGQQIRVSSLDHKRIALAEVVDLGVLKGSFSQ